MKMPFKDRQLFGLGAAACAVCCAGPILVFLGIAGTAATIATFVFAGAAFGLVVAGATLFAVLKQQLSRKQRAVESGLVDIEIGSVRPIQRR